MRHDALATSILVPGHIQTFRSEWTIPNGHYRNACQDASEEEQEILYQLHIIHTVCASLSVIGALSIILYSIWKKSVRTPEVRPLFHLSVADVFLGICWISGASLWDKPLLHNSVSFKVCTVLQALTEMFNITTFYLTTNYALNVYVRLKDKLHRSEQLPLLQSSKWMVVFLKIFMLMSWLLPALVMLPAMIIPVLQSTHRMEEQPCLQCLILFFTPSAEGFPVKSEKWFHTNYGAFCFIVSLIISIVLIMVLYFLSIRIVYGKLFKTNVWTDKQRHQVRDVTLRITCYILVFLFCWTPALALSLIDLTKDVTVVKYRWLFYIQGMTAPSQGFLNCIVYGWTKKSFRMAQLPASTTPMIKTTYRVYGTAEGQTKFPAKLRIAKTPTPPPVASSASESNQVTPDRFTRAGWYHSPSQSEFSN